jgi:hypothetical protein
MLEIIVRRSDAHLREVLRVYQDLYGENFARAALKKSGNLVVSRLPNPHSYDSLPDLTLYPRAK